jgi:molybdenum cofactor guanylyltransferase
VTASGARPTRISRGSSATRVSGCRCSVPVAVSTRSTVRREVTRGMLPILPRSGRRGPHVPAATKTATKTAIKTAGTARAGARPRSVRGVAGYAAVILAGGAGRRLGGAGKPMLAVHGRPMLERVLDAVADADVTIVVGPETLPLPGGVVRVSEEPAGGGPVAATAAGLAALAEIGADADTDPGPGLGGHTVALLAADLPFLDARAVTALRAALSESTVDGVVFADADGRRQTLCGVWRAGPLRAALDRLGPPAGASMRALLSGLRVGELADRAQPPPWYDCDQPDDLLRAEEWTDERP